PTRQPPPWLRRARERPDEQFADPPSLSGLAAEAGVPPGYLAGQFRRPFRCSPGEDGRPRRVQEAPPLLARGRPAPAPGARGRRARGPAAPRPPPQAPPPPPLHPPPGRLAAPPPPRPPLTFRRCQPLSTVQDRPRRRRDNGPRTTTPRPRRHHHVAPRRRAR